MPARISRPYRSWARIASCAALIACAVWLIVQPGLEAAQQEPAAPQPVSAEKLQSAIDTLGALNYEIRTAAARTVRRTATVQAVPALINAISSHADSYVRYKAAVLLTGFNDPRTKDVMHESLTTPNDRLRAVAYAYFEENPDPDTTDALLTALDRESSEFVRPSLVRALAAYGDNPRVQAALGREVNRGEDFFRSSVIEGLGDHKALYAFDAIAAIAKLDGPLADDAALALGKIGDRRALPVLAGLQRSAPQATQPFVAAAICLLGTNCDTHEGYLRETLSFADQNPGFQELLRGAAAGLGALAVSGRVSAASALVQAGTGARESTRAPVALALATVALRNAPLILGMLQTGAPRADAIELLAEGFDMLEEDLDKERFFVVVRRSYWGAADGSARRELMQSLIGKMDF